MNILVLNYEYPPLGGGAGSVCQQLCRVYARRGHGVHVVTMGFRDLPRQEEDDGVRITRVPAWRKRAATCDTREMLSYVASAFPRVVSLLRGGKYDVVHCHFVVPTGLLAYAATRFASVPYIITAHGSDIPGFNPDRFTSEHRIMPPLLRTIMRGASEVVAPSQYLCSLIRQIFPSEVRYIPNGIDIATFRVRPKHRRILMTGRLLPRKGFQYVLRALQEIDTDWEVHIAGDGPIRAQLEELARKVKPRVIFHGWLEHDSPMLKELYETSSIFCLPSEQENASISLLEAMLAGMAVITSDASGCPETVGDTAILVPPRDPERVRDALRRLLDSEATRKRLGMLARKRVEDAFDWEKIADDYLEHLRKASRETASKPRHPS